MERFCVATVEGFTVNMPTDSAYCEVAPMK